jgi:glycosyltransferase involved in cell wall biosynthesis
VVGDGECRSDLEQLAARLGLQGRVHFTGWRRDVAAVLADVDVVALSSRNEGTPVALIEALASATPVVATHVGGVPDVVDDDVTGLLVPPGDPVAFALALERVLGDAALRHRFGTEGRARVQDRFSLDRLLGAIDDLYHELLDSVSSAASPC